jgi:hypothetical protein
LLFLSSEYSLSFVPLTFLIHGVTPLKLLICHFTQVLTADYTVCN